MAGDTSRFAFISDVHSNLEALEAVLAEVGDLQGVYCLGDIVGYGASPNEVVTLLRDVNAVCIVGNHDLAALEGDAGDFNPSAAIAAMWTSKSLTEESREFLTELPKERSETVGGGARVYMAHGSPEDPTWEYVRPSTHSDLFDYYLRKVDAEVIALGHTHIPFEWRSVLDGGGLVFNPGSVGQPRDGDRRASYAVLKVELVTEEGGHICEVEHRHVEYDVESAGRKIVESGLPPALANRLLSGQ